MILDIVFAIIGVLLLLKLSPLVVKYSVNLGKIFNISPMLIGIIAIAIGTSIPEITNSIVSSVTGHADINIGGSVGSALSQISLIIGISVLIGGSIRTQRKNMFILGSATILSTIISYYLISTGSINRMEGFFLVITYVTLYYLINNGVTKEEYVIDKKEAVMFSDYWKKYTFFLLLAMGGLVVGSSLLVDSIVNISSELGVEEYIVSFLVVSVGTSLPELFVGINAIKKGEHELFLGDILGSNITDLTLSLGLGPLFKPNVFEGSAGVIGSTSAYLVIVTVIIVLIIGINKKIDRKTALLFILMYFLSYVFVF